MDNGWILPIILLGLIVVGALWIGSAEILCRRRARSIVNALRPETDEAGPLSPTD